MISATYRCRKCSAVLFTGECLVTPFGNSTFDSDSLSASSLTSGRQEAGLVGSSFSATITSPAPGFPDFAPQDCELINEDTLWYINENRPPPWVQEALVKAQWTQGKLHCPRCHGRLGMFDFLTLHKCSCQKHLLPPIRIIKQRVDLIPTTSAINNTGLTLETSGGGFESFSSGGLYDDNISETIYRENFFHESEMKNWNDFHSANFGLLEAPRSASPCSPPVLENIGYWNDEHEDRGSVSHGEKRARNNSDPVCNVWPKVETFRIKEDSSVCNGKKRESRRDLQKGKRGEPRNNPHSSVRNNLMNSRRNEERNRRWSGSRNWVKNEVWMERNESEIRLNQEMQNDEVFYGNTREDIRKTDFPHQQISNVQQHQQQQQQQYQNLAYPHLGNVVSVNPLEHTTQGNLVITNHTNQRNFSCPHTPITQGQVDMAEQSWQRQPNHVTSSVNALGQSATPVGSFNSSLITCSANFCSSLNPTTQSKTPPTVPTSMTALYQRAPSPLFNKTQMYPQKTIQINQSQSYTESSNNNQQIRLSSENQIHSDQGRSVLVNSWTLKREHDTKIIEKKPVPSQGSASKKQGVQTDGKPVGLQLKKSQSPSMRGNTVLNSASGDGKEALDSTSAQKISSRSSKSNAEETWTTVHHSRVPQHKSGNSSMKKNSLGGRSSKASVRKTSDSAAVNSTKNEIQSSNAAVSKDSHRRITTSPLRENVRDETADMERNNTGNTVVLRKNHKTEYSNDNRFSVLECPEMDIIKSDDEKEEPQQQDADPGSDAAPQKPRQVDEDKYSCSVCLDWFYHPHTVHPCNHVFCDPCLRQLAKNASVNTTKCPLCRELIKGCTLNHRLTAEVKGKFLNEYLSRHKLESKVKKKQSPLPGTRMVKSTTPARVPHSTVPIMVSELAGICCVLLSCFTAFIVFFITVSFIVLRLWDFSIYTFDTVRDLFAYMWGSFRIFAKSGNPTLDQANRANCFLLGCVTGYAVYFFLSKYFQRRNLTRP